MKKPAAARLGFRFCKSMTTGGLKLWQHGIIQTMKTKLCVLIFLLAAALAQAQTNNLTALLQSGLFEEQANRNLDAAIADYTSLAMQFDKDRQLAATAVFRLGECYRAQGKTNEAAAQYQRILRDFSDEQTLATLSRQNLTGMGMTKTETAAAENSDVQLWNKLKDMPRDEQEKILPTLVPDAAFIILLQRRNETEATLAQMQVNFSAEHPEVLKQKASLTVLNKQIAARIDGILAGLKMRAEIFKSSSTLSGNQPPNGASTSEEDQEIQRIQQMIQNSPDLINAAPQSGILPLRNAASAGQIKVATFLLDHGANINLAQSDGWTPLYDAANAGNRAMVELLLSRGADVDAKTHEGKTPLYVAVEKGFQAGTAGVLAN